MTQPGPGSRDTVAARALVVPGSLASTSEDGMNNLSIDARTSSYVHLVVIDGADERSAPSSAQRVRVSVPNWLRIVMYYAGTTTGPADQFPPEVHVPVRVEATTRRIVDVDIAAAEVELAAHRDVAKRHWLESEAPLAGMRGIGGLPGDAIAGARELLGTWRGAARGVRDQLRRRSPGQAASEVAESAPPQSLGAPAWTPAEAEQARRTAVVLRHRLDQHPKEHARLRESALASGPASAAQVRHGLRHPVDFQHWLMIQETSGVLTHDEVLQLSAVATPPGASSSTDTGELEDP